MNCQKCSKKKEDFEVWSNKIVIAASYDSELQNHQEIRRMDEKSVICHDCMQSIIDEVEQKRR